MWPMPNGRKVSNWQGRFHSHKAEWEHWNGPTKAYTLAAHIAV